MSAAEVARELNITHANASYHLRVLADAGELVDAGEERIRGGIAKRYRHPWRDGHAVGDTPEERLALVRAAADELIRRVGLRRPRSKMSFTDAELWVAPEVWQRVSALVKEATELLHAEA